MAAIVAIVSAVAIVVVVVLRWGLAGEAAPIPSSGSAALWTRHAPLPHAHPDELLLGGLATLALADASVTASAVAWLRETWPALAPPIEAAIAAPASRPAVVAANDALRAAGQPLALAPREGRLEPLVLRGRVAHGEVEILVVEGALPEPVDVAPDRVVIALSAVQGWFWDAVRDPSRRTAAFDGVSPEVLAALTRPDDADTLAGDGAPASLQAVADVLSAEVARLAGAALARIGGRDPETAPPVPVPVEDPIARRLR